MDRTTIIKLRRLLAELYEESRQIRQVIDDAGLNASRINLGGSVTNIWHEVLAEAQKVDKVDQLIEVVLLDYPEKHTALDELLGRPSSVERIPDSTPQPTKQTPAATSAPQPATPTPELTIARPAITPPRRAIPIDAPRTLRLTEMETQLLSTLFAQATNLVVRTEFTDGRTATRVFLIQPTDAEGVVELPVVVKIGPQELIEPEWQATQRHVLGRLPGFAAVQGEPIYLAQLDGTMMGALRYGQVGDGVFAVESLASYLAKASLIDSWHLLENRLFRQLGQLWRSTLTWQPLLVQNSYDAILPVNLVVTPVATGTPTTRLDGRQLAGTVDPVPTVRLGDLVEIANFVITEIAGDELTLNLPQTPNARRTAYRLRLQGAQGDDQVGATLPTTLARVTSTREELLRNSAQAQVGAQVDLTQSTLTLPGSSTRRLPNPLPALSTLLTQGHEANFATIHGDLNLRNVLVDAEARTTHIIDCAAARQDHALQDLLRMERDYVTDVLANLFFQTDLPSTTLVRLYQCVHCATRSAPAASGHFSLPIDLPAILHKPFVLLVTLRRAARELLAKPEQWGEYYTGLIIHLLGALKFRDLDNAPAGQQPKALAFWGAAVTLDLLQELQSGQTRTCRDINWRFFDVTKGERPDVISKGLSPVDPTAAQSLSLEHSGLESFIPDATTAPTADDLAPVQRRLDVAAPEQATLGRAFSLAVAVRQLTSPALQLAELPLTRSGQALLDWPAAERFIRLRAEVIAPECEIVGAASYTFKLYRNLDSELYYFSLIPKVTGRLSIIVRLYQEEDMLGSALAHTTVGEQVVSEVPVQVHSESMTIKRTAEGSQAEAQGPRAQPNAGQPLIKLLFLAANPLDTVRLRTDEEARAIDLALRQADYRVFDIRTHQAVRLDDLQDLLLRHQPDILHFSGHGSTANELILHDAQGNSLPVRGAALSRLFRVLKGNIRCIVLNACYTAEQATAMAEVIDCVVGIEDVISDEASLQFATAFYRALGYGKSVQDAFELGQVQIEMAGLGDTAALHLHTRQPTAAQLHFAGEEAAGNPVTPTPANTPSSTLAPGQPPRETIAVKLQETLQTGSQSVMPKRQLTTQSKMQLVTALLACPSMANRQTRDAIVNDLPDAIKGNIRRNDADRVDLINIVTTAANYANGLEELITLVRFYEGDSLPMQGVDQLLSA